MTMEELLASHSAQSKPLNLYRGQQIEGEVVAVNDKEITLDLGNLCCLISKKIKLIIETSI